MLKSLELVTVNFIEIKIKIVKLEFQQDECGWLKLNLL